MCNGSSAVCCSACELPCLEQLEPRPAQLQAVRWAAAWREPPRRPGWMADLPRWHHRTQRRSDSHERPVGRQRCESVTRHENEWRVSRRISSENKQLSPHGTQQQSEKRVSKSILWQSNATSGEKTKRVTTEFPSKAPVDVAQWQSTSTTAPKSDKWPLLWHTVPSWTGFGGRRVVPRGTGGRWQVPDGSVCSTTTVPLQTLY